ncbi:hypothetical protein POM88_012097 [Heracleum sosnowskyi]|uniref:Uncharacterized protein n=1 Tax=Heracleum sosnowskyi TaxID=360622 RepID=A0AAD8IYB6_9APIA|nr:hypothetical protein POM88_012097 [Heracleum sosnowskyi]
MDRRSRKDRVNYERRAEEKRRESNPQEARQLPRPSGSFAHAQTRCRELKIDTQEFDFQKDMTEASRCISQNSYLIFDILKAFAPLLDMSQNLDICEQDLQNLWGGGKHRSPKEEKLECYESTTVSYSVASECDTREDKRTITTPHLGRCGREQ